MLLILPVSKPGATSTSSIGIGFGERSTDCWNCLLHGFGQTFQNCPRSTSASGFPGSKRFKRECAACRCKSLCPPFLSVKTVLGILWVQTDFQDFLHGIPVLSVLWATGLNGD